VEKNHKHGFRSVLEMLKLIDEALAESAEGTAQAETVNW
jgi:hypothetical protein